MGIHMDGMSVQELVITYLCGNCYICVEAYLYRQVTTPVLRNRGFYEYTVKLLLFT